MKIMMLSEPPCDLCGKDEPCKRFLVGKDTFDLCSECIQLSEKDMRQQWKEKQWSEKYKRYMQ